MNKDKRIDYLKNKIQKYKHQPIYYLDYFTRNASEVYVNDLLVYSNFTDETGSLRVIMNTALLSGGAQKIKIVMYPEADKNGNMGEFLSTESFLELKVTEGEWIEGELMEKEPVINYYSKKDESLQYFVFNQNNKWIKEFTFNANLPYKLMGWSESVNLIELNKKQSIKPKVEEAFKAIWKDWNDQNSNAINTRNLVRQSEINTYDYRDEAYVEKQQNALEKVFSEQEGTSEMLPLENYEMYIMGNGKLVTLLRTDKENRMEPVLMKKYDNREAEGVTSYYYFLHIPKGKTEFEVIR